MTMIETWKVKTNLNKEGVFFAVRVLLTSARTRSAKDPLRPCWGSTIFRGFLNCLTFQQDISLREQITQRKEQFIH